MSRGDDLSRIGTSALATIGDRELPDVVLPVSEREELKRIIRAFENNHSHHALAYLSNGLWAAAERKAKKT